jgi:hypothetical protein
VPSRSIEIRDRVEPQTVDAHLEPEAHHVENRLEDDRVVEVQVGLVAEEAMPVVLLRHRVPGPVRRFSVSVKMMRASCVLVRIVAPHVEVALRRAAWRVRARWNHAC